MIGWTGDIISQSLTVERGGFDILVVEIVRKGNCHRRPIQLLIRTPL